MTFRLPHAALAALLLLLQGVETLLSWRVEEALVVPAAEVVLRGQSDEDTEDHDSRTFQRIKDGGATRRAEYGFLNFNRDMLQIRFEVAKSALASYEGGFGYSKKELAALGAWHDQARQAAYQEVVKRNLGQARLDAAYAALKAQYEKRVEDYMRSRGFVVLPGRVVQADVPGIVRRSAAPLKGVALAFDQIASSRRYDSDSLIGAVTSLVQTALVYKLPPTLSGETHTGGILPPVKTLSVGWGDCDTKTALLGSILSNWPHMRMIGVDLPEHYLLAVLRIPAKGDLFVEHGGLRYVLVEPAGPAWLPPGQVGRETLALLERFDGTGLQPFF